MITLETFLTEFSEENTKKVITGKDFNRYSISYSDLYLIYDTNKLHRPRKKEIFEVPEKILLRQTGSYPICSVDTEQYYTLDTVHNGLIIDIQYNSKYLLALLNSKLLKFLYSQKINETGKTFAQVKIIYIDQLSIKKASIDQQTPFIEKADLMLNLNRQLKQSADEFLSFIKQKYNLKKLSHKLKKFHELNFHTFLNSGLKPAVAKEYRRNGTHEPIQQKKPRTHRPQGRNRQTG